MVWLETEVTKLGEQKKRLESDLSLLHLAKADLVKKSGLENLEATAKEFISKFTELTGIQQRSFIERMIAKIVIKKDNKLELHVLWEPKKNVTRTTRSSIRKENGGLHPDLIERLCRPHTSLDIIEFYHTPSYKDKFVLHQKYIIEGLSIRQIASQFLSSKEAIRMALKHHGIPLRRKSLPHGRPSQVKYGQKRIRGKLQDSVPEQRIINAIKEMKYQGLSLRQIAKNLSTMKIPTKENGKKWHPEMVKRILHISNH